MLVSWLLEKLHARANTLTGLKTSQSANASVLTTTQDFAQSRRDLAIKFIDDERYAEAEAQYRFLIDNNVSNKSDYVSLGFVLKSQNKLLEARQVLENVLDVQDSKADVHYMLASIYTAEGLNDLAAANFDAALKCNSHLRPAYFEYCGLLCSQDKFDIANEIVTLGLIHFPADVELLIQKGNICVVTKKFQSACECFEKVVTADPDNVSAYLALYAALHVLGSHAQALDWLNVLLVRQPDNARALHEKGRVLNILRRPAEAIVSLNRALEIDPENVDAIIERGSALVVLGCFAEGIDAFLQAIEKNPKSIPAYLNAGTAAYRMGNSVRALEFAEKAEELIFSEMTEAQRLTLESLDLTQFSEGIDVQFFGGAQYNLAMFYLSLGEFFKGWRAHEWRWNTPDFVPHKRKFPSRLWLGNEKIIGKSILLYAEQGFGDTLQFVRYVRLVKDLGADVSLQVPPGLKRLLDGATGADRIFGVGEALPQTDFHCPLMSLPLSFRTTLETIPKIECRFHLEKTFQAKSTKWKERLSLDKVKRVGLVWSGNVGHGGDQYRSIPLKKFVTILSKQTKFYSLQKEVRPNDRDILRLAPEITDYTVEISDFLDTAAFIYQLDLVISVDTSVAHLAASMGKPTWILLPFAADWRWLVERTDSPWYPSVTLFRQSQHDNWDDVLETVAIRLQNNLN